MTKIPWSEQCQMSSSGVVIARILISFKIFFLSIYNLFCYSGNRKTKSIGKNGKCVALKFLLNFLLNLFLDLYFCPLLSLSYLGKMFRP